MPTESKKKKRRKKFHNQRMGGKSIKKINGSESNPEQDLPSHKEAKEPKKSKEPINELNFEPLSEIEYVINRWLTNRRTCFQVGLRG